MKISKTNFMLGAIVLLAFILRLIAAHNTHVSTDEMIYSIIPLNIISADRLGTVEQSPLAFYLTDIGYQIFGGISGINVRLPAIIFGTLTTMVIFLIGRDLWNKKAGLISAFLFAISGHALSFNYETDMMAFFFVLLSLYYFLKYFREGKPSSLYLTTLFFGLGILSKTPVILFIPIFISAFIYNSWKKKTYKSKKTIKTIIIALVIGFLTLMPLISYNYLTYKESGITDAYFSLYLGIGESVHTGAESEPWTAEKLWYVTSVKLKNNFFLKDVILFTFGVLGMLLAFKSKNRFAVLFILSTAIVFHLKVAGHTGSSSHFLWYPVVFSLFSGIGLVHLSKIFKEKFKFKHVITVVLLAGVISSLFVMNSIIQQREESITLSLRDYVKEEISDNALVVIDPRIYRGIHAWVFNDKHYLEGTNFGSLVNQIQESPERKVDVDLYYIECAEGTKCGWKPEDFARIYDVGEEISQYFRGNTELVKEIRTAHNFNIYKGRIPMTSGAYTAVDRTHKFWFYPVGWKFTDDIVDNYTAVGFGKFMEFIGFVILWTTVVLSFLVAPFVLWLGFKKEHI